MCSITALVGYILHTIWFQEIGHPGKDGTLWFTHNDLFLWTGLSRATLKQVIDDLVIHRVIQQRKMKGMGYRMMEYSLSQQTRDVVLSTRMFEYYMPPIKEVMTTILEEKKKDRVSKNSILSNQKRVFKVKV
jgi:hypothetical protein